MTVHFSLLPTCFILPSFPPSDNPFVFPPLIRDFIGSFAVSLSRSGNLEVFISDIRQQPHLSPIHHPTYPAPRYHPPTPASFHLVLILIPAHPCGVSPEAPRVAMFSSLPARAANPSRHRPKCIPLLCVCTCVKINLSPHACMSITGCCNCGFDPAGI